MLIIISCQIFRLFLTICREMVTFTPILCPVSPQDAPKWVKYTIMVKMDTTIKFSMLIIISYQIYRFFWPFVGRWAHLPHFVPRFTPWDALNSAKYSIILITDARNEFAMSNTILNRCLMYFIIFERSQRLFSRHFSLFWAYLTPFTPLLWPRHIWSTAKMTGEGLQGMPLYGTGSKIYFKWS